MQQGQQSTYNKDNNHHVNQETKSYQKRTKVFNKKCTKRRTHNVSTGHRHIAESSYLLLYHVWLLLLMSVHIPHHAHVTKCEINMT